MLESKNFPISRLNNYDPVLKKHRGSVVSIQSSLHSINEAEELKSDHSQEMKKAVSAIQSDQARLKPKS